MLVGELTTFKSYKKKTNLLAKQIDVKFIIKNKAPKESVLGEAGDYLALDDEGNPYVIPQSDFEATYEEA